MMINEVIINYNIIYFTNKRIYRYTIHHKDCGLMKICFSPFLTRLYHHGRGGVDVGRSETGDNQIGLSYT